MADLGKAAYDLAQQNAAKLDSKTYTNLISTADFSGLFPYTGAGYPTTDNGANDSNCTATTVSAFPFQRYRVKAKSGRKYLFTVKVKGTTVTNTTFSLAARYSNTSTDVPGSAAPSGNTRSITKTAPFDYQLLAMVVTMDSGGSAIDFTIALTQNNKDTVWQYKEAMIVDITNVSAGSVIGAGYFSATFDASAGSAATRWGNKNVLAIGDSLTAALKWQETVETMHKCTITTHAKGGIGLLAMVDGDGAATNPIAALTSADVSGKDLIILFGGMNERSTPYGALGDVYPTQDTLYGRMQYVINKLYSLLQAANNLTCKILVVTPHCPGKYAWIDVDGYGEYPSGSGQTLEKLVNHLKTCANYNNLRVVDLWHNSGIGKNTWSVYMASATATITPPEGSTAPYPANGDQLHPNDAGYALFGVAIGVEMNMC